MAIKRKWDPFPLMEQIDPTGEKLFNGQPLDCLQEATVKAT